ncbi:hypothetical protein [Okeania sp. SIO2B3]|uniref:hypothetical protein n=1 Tax=Okeania sp. SIO2B3 TaxID=2607784 RepID=UPI0013C20B2D|nr:hypothetical protein [Okeania sp. SIO2B3]NET45769.1 hypothetical protein [Okeania sp. SIO2B3]
MKIEITKVKQVLATIVLAVIIAMGVQTLPADAANVYNCKVEEVGNVCHYILKPGDIIMLDTPDTNLEEYPILLEAANLSHLLDASLWYKWIPESGDSDFAAYNLERLGYNLTEQGQVIEENQIEQGHYITNKGQGIGWVRNRSVYENVDIEVVIYS